MCKLKLNEDHTYCIYLCKEAYQSLIVQRFTCKIWNRSAKMHWVLYLIADIWKFRNVIQYLTLILQFFFFICLFFFHCEKCDIIMVISQKNFILLFSIMLIASLTLVMMIELILISLKRNLYFLLLRYFSFISSSAFKGLRFCQWIASF